MKKIKISDKLENYIRSKGNVITIGKFLEMAG